MTDADRVIPRDLTEAEEADLRKQLTSQLNITTLIQDEEDAETLLEYAFDMIKGGDTIGQVVEEVRYDVCLIVTQHTYVDVCAESKRLISYTNVFVMFFFINNRLYSWNCQYAAKRREKKLAKS